MTISVGPDWLDPPDEAWLSDEPPFENGRHVTQMLGLIQTLRWRWRDRHDYFCCGRLSIHYASRRKLGPDFFVCLDVEQRDRSSWIPWLEGGRYPDVIVELTDANELAVDRGEKKQIYQDIFRVPAYFIFDPDTGQLEGYRLVVGRFHEIAPDADGLLACEPLGLSLGVRDGSLRYFTPDGKLVETPQEQALRLQAELDALRRT